MIAAARRRIDSAASRAASATRKVDRRAIATLEKLRPKAARAASRARATGLRAGRAAGRRLRPVGVLLLRGFSRAERALQRAAALATKTATRASAALTPQRAVCAVVVAAAACLIAAQFVTYRSVEIGQPGYAGLEATAPPTAGARTPFDAHSFVLIPIALLAAAAAVAALRPERRGLGRITVALGLISIVVILLVDLPAGLDEGVLAARFAGATAVLESGFYAQLAAAAGLVIGGLLYYARPCRIPINLSGRAASARRRRRQRRDSSPRKAARRRLPRRSGEASAPASRP
jgi:hypothetical protein